MALYKSNPNLGPRDDAPDADPNEPPPAAAGLTDHWRKLGYDIVPTNIGPQQMYTRSTLDELVRDNSDSAHHLWEFERARLDYNLELNDDE